MKEKTLSRVATWFAVFAVCMVLSAFVKPAQATTIDFNAVVVLTPPSYTESGMTFTSLGGHVHFNTIPGALFNHELGGSTPYEITFGGAAFNLISMDVVGLGTIAFGPSDWTSSTGGFVTVPASVGPFFFPAVGFTNVTSVLWDQITGGNMAIDNLVFTPVTAVPEPSTLLLLGFGLAGLVGVRRKRKRA